MKYTVLCLLQVNGRMFNENDTIDGSLLTAQQVLELKQINAIAEQPTEQPTEPAPKGKK